MADLTTEKQEIFDYVFNSLGGGMVDVELDPAHYETALKDSLDRFRQRSDNSVEESYIFLPLVKDQNDYTLANEIIEVRQIFRRSIGSRSGGGDGGTLFEPFNLAYTNTYLLASSNMGGGDGGTLFEPFNLAYTNTYLLASSNMGGVATYNMFSQFQELVGRMFGSFIEFKWNTTTKKLTILQRPRQGEEVLMYVYMYRPDTELFKDYLAKKWIKDYTLAKCKFMLGEARSKFNTIAGPQGGTTLNGDALKQEAQAEMDRLDTEIKTQTAGGQGYSFLIG